jgi:polyphosphate kinase
MTRTNPRVSRVVAQPAPTERERTQWYFQRHAPDGTARTFIGLARAAAA